MFTVYSKPSCPHCDQAKALLSAKGIEYKVVNLDVGQPKMAGETYISRDDLLSLFPGARTMPQINRVVEDEVQVVGGFTELKKLLG